jgi:hypothetical protein
VVLSGQVMSVGRPAQHTKLIGLRRGVKAVSRPGLPKPAALMIRLQEERGLAYLFVTHDLDIARLISQRTQALVRAAPRLTTRRKTTKPALPGDIPNAIDR